MKKLTLVRKTKQSGDTNCPALYSTNHGTYVVVGTLVSDIDVMAQIMNMKPDEVAVEIPNDVLLEELPA